MHPILTLEHVKIMLEYISDGVQIVDGKGNLIYCNHNSALLDDINIEESIGKHITEIYPSLKEDESTLLKVLTTQLPILNREQTYRTYKGKSIATINSTLPIINDGVVAGAIEISRDITSYKELSEKVIDLQSKVAGKNSEELGTNRMLKHGFRFEDIITAHSEFNRVKAIAMKAATTDIAVLIYGETGTGKELLTQAIHNNSRRKNKPFIAQNCAALPGSLLEGILFGTVKGGFTGAVDRPGLFELADTGTLFLDEINSMPQELQAKLLRVLQDGKIRRIGDTKERLVDVRIVAATNIEPNLAIDLGLIRRDLYYRLNTVTLWIPKLSDRKEDIPLLTKYFIKKYNGLLYRGIKGTTPEVMKLFLNYPWEGNVRELEHVIEGAVNFVDGDLISIEDLPYNLKKYYEKNNEKPSDKTVIDPDEGLIASLYKAEIELIHHAMIQSEGNIALAARLLKIPRQTLQYKLKKYKIE
ncbi:sigma 54-interacting transcriptional regulator [Fusibacter bizertensis]|jgi:PAS domain S-box|uniref:Sigma 54-interacting transcriptional regulator n=1 Tax=Fusibacter bizertensis TaxID=1488331 RepID=A0ABT6NFQ3_9FIRM|nr:sigma 54-interacting transcriptional regulator [Fusibacter bizertensis]MDH8679226.1 sigma 54-interacting transcriptional regulator [Fusibacter bizertensis]